MKSLAFTIAIVVISATIGLQPSARAQGTSKATSLDELLKQIKSGSQLDSAELAKREAAFQSAKEDQQKLLKQTEQQLAVEQARGERLEREFDNNKQEVTQREAALKSRLGTMGELFGVIRQFAGETKEQLKSSMISAQFPNRGQSLDELAINKGLPSIEQLENLWYIMQHEMTESGKIVRFKAPVVTKQGEENEREVVRVGPFNAISRGKFLVWNGDMAKLNELKRQPDSRYLATAAEFERAKQGLAKLAVDPSKGQVLSLLVETPEFWERIQQGGVIGYIIIGLAILTLFGAVIRLIYLFVVSLKVRRQQGSGSIRENNPLGRVLSIYQKNTTVDTETLEAKLDEVILQETTKLDRFMWAIKIVSVVAPLLGLLGTVTGMIQTFQAITLFGTGDPKMMAGGISEALVTTMLGLFAAIPLVLMHSWLKSISRGVVDTLEQQSAGLIAKRMEQAG